MPARRNPPDGTSSACVSIVSVKFSAGTAACGAQARGRPPKVIDRRRNVRRNAADSLGQLRGPFERVDTLDTANVSPISSAASMVMSASPRRAGFLTIEEPLSDAQVAVPGA